MTEIVIDEQLRDAFEQWSEEAKWRHRLTEAASVLLDDEPRFHAVLAFARNQGKITEAEMQYLHASLGRLARILHRSIDAEARNQTETCFCHLPKCTWHPEQNHR
jgi:hypothetical protein